MADPLEAKIQNLIFEICRAAYINFKGGLHDFQLMLLKKNF